MGQDRRRTRVPGIRRQRTAEDHPKACEPVTRRSSSPSVPLGSRSSSSYVTKASASLFPPIDRSDPIEIEGNTVRVYERDGVRHMLLSDYQHQVREQRRG